MWQFFKEREETCRLANPAAKQIWNFSVSQFKVGCVYIYVYIYSRKKSEECSSLVGVDSDSLSILLILQTAYSGWFSMFLA